MLTFSFVEGNPRTAFSQLYSLVLSETAAKKFFGTDRNVVGKKVFVDNKQAYIITGLAKDFPANASLPFQWYLLLAPSSYTFKYNISRTGTLDSAETT
jgi:hypothetical protein